MGKREEGELPVGWRWSTIGDVGFIQLGRQRAPKYHTGATMRPYLRVQNVFEDRIDLDDVMEMDFPGDDVERYELKPGDILLNEGQSPVFLGRPAMYQGELPGACFTNTLIRFQAGPTVNSRFCLLLFRHYMKNRTFLDEGTITTNIAHLGAGRFAALSFPLPPLPEQQRIAARLDLLLGKLKAARARLDALPDFIARFRKSVLSEAVSGRLTEEWREEHGIIEPWEEVVLEDIADVVGGITKDSSKQIETDEEVPYLRVANVKRGYLDLSEVKRIRIPAKRIESLLLEKGDVLFNEGGDLDKVGRGWIWQGELERCSFQNHIFRARLHDPQNCPKFISWWGNTKGLQHFLRGGKQTTGLASISRTMLCRLPIQVPSSPEQHAIVRRVEELFAYADALEKRVADARALAARLEPSILAKAFRGELSQQIPEEAAEWERTLAEIEAARAKLVTTAGGKKLARPKKNA